MKGKFRKTIKCAYCRRKFRIMTQSHSMKCNGMTILEYLEAGNMVAPSYFCVNCGEKVNDALNTKSKRCKPCNTDYVKMVRRYNSHIYNGKRKKFIASMMRDANREHGIMVMNDGDPYNQSTRIDLTHSGWDFVPNTSLNSIGSVSKSDLEVDENGRVKGLMKLKREIEWMKNRKR